jgi:PKD repeat protein
MKKIILLAGLAIILFTSCERKHEPNADFVTNSTLVVPGEVVFFTNYSEYVERVEWDFGDGYASTEYSPNHYYSSEGVYNVRLTVYGDGYIDYAYAQIEVYYPAPIADFSVNNSLVEPQEIVFFYNNSQFAESFEWNFGDGTTSNVANPSHYYRNEGLYTVQLAAFNHGYVNYVTMVIEVYSTTLEIEVREYYSEALIPYVAITLYDTYDDWYNFTNPIISADTDENGVVIFKGVNTISYYIDAYSEFYDNNQLGQEDIGFVKTLPLMYATHNVFIAYVDYYPEGSANGKVLKSTERKRTMVVKEIKRVYKEKTSEVK